LGDHSDYAANLSSDDFRDRDWHAYELEMQMIIDKLTNQLISAFNTFIININYPSSIDVSRLNLITESYFINFNYTDTLERYYSSDPSNICYIHSRAKKGELSLVLGHGTESAKFIPKSPVPPPDLPQDQLNERTENMNDQYDYSYESAKSHILTYFEKAFKNATLIIQKNAEFFENLRNIENIFILGHSLSDIDIEYFKEIKNDVRPSVNWNVTYYSETEKSRHREALSKIGIALQNINQIKIDEFKMAYA